MHPHGLVHDADFLTYDFITTMLNALGIYDPSGVIFEQLEHDYFNPSDLGSWDSMVPGMINVRTDKRGRRPSKPLRIYLWKTSISRKIFSRIFVSRRKTCCVEIVRRKNDILPEIIMYC